MPFFGAIYAIILSLKDYPFVVESQTDFSVSTTLECSRCSDSYLRAVFYLSESKYFGYTKNNLGNWISTISDKTQYFAVLSDQVQSGTWSGQLQVRPDYDSPEYAGPGDYNFKIIRYTASGSKSTESDSVIIHLQGPTQNPTAAPPTSVPTKNNPTKTLPTKAVPTNTPAPLLSPTAIIRITSQVLAEAASIPSASPFFPSSTAPAATINPIPFEKTTPTPYFGIICIGMGVMGSVFSVVRMFFSKK